MGVEDGAMDMEGAKTRGPQAARRNGKEEVGTSIRTLLGTCSESWHFPQPNYLKGGIENLTTCI